MIETPCKHCKKPKGQHLAKTFNCPLPSRSQWKSFSNTSFYEGRVPTKKDIEKHAKQFKIEGFGKILGTYGTVVEWPSLVDTNDEEN